MVESREREKKKAEREKKAESRKREEESRKRAEEKRRKKAEEEELERNFINIAQDIDENQSRHKQLEEGDISELERLRW